MIEIKDLLLKFNKILLSEEAKKDSIRKVIADVIGVPIKPEQIKIKNNVIYLDIKPIYKSEILLKEAEIYSKIEEHFGNRSPKSIR